MQPAVSPAPQENSSEASRLTGVFHAPGSVFADIAANGKWWIPTIIMVVLLAIFMHLVLTHVGTDNILQKMMDANPKMQEMPADQRAKAIEMQRSFVPMTMRIVGPVGMLVYYLIIAAVLMFTFNMAMDGGLKYKQALNITAYAGFAPGIVSMFMTYLVLFLKPVDEYDIQHPLASNLGEFLSVDTVGKFVHSLAGSLDVFTIWSIILLGIGFSSAIGTRKVPTGKAIGTICGLWAVWVLGKAMLATIF